jgi:hypothetical protein
MLWKVDRHTFRTDCSIEVCQSGNDRSHSESESESVSR